MKTFTKHIPLLILVVTIITIALQVFDLPFWLRILLAAVAIAATIQSYRMQQKSDRNVDQRFEYVQQVATKRDSVRNFEDIFAGHRRATQQTSPKDKA